MKEIGYHRQDLREYFNDCWEGIDLGNTELKSCHKPDQKWTIHPKDLKGNFIVFFNYNNDTWYFVNVLDIQQAMQYNEMKRIHHKRSISMFQIEKYAYFTTTLTEEMKTEMETIVKEPNKYLKWVTLKLILEQPIPQPISITIEN